MTAFDWRPFLEQYSRDLVSDRQLKNQLPEEVIRSGWMGFEPATPQQVRDLEVRIGAKLPESYRQFLATSNGWRQSGGFIYEILPCDKVEWLRVNNQEWIDAYIEPATGQAPLSVEEHCVYGDQQESSRFRVEFLQSCLMISDVGDSAVYLLNPEIKTTSGEWEGWFFANWMAGAVRYPTFWELMQAEWRSFVRLRDINEKRFFPEDGIETLPPKLPGLLEDLAEKAAGHRLGQQQRASRGRSANEQYTDGVVEALNDAEAAVKRTAAISSSPDELLQHLIQLAAKLEREWKENVRPGSCGVDNREGRAEGNREAMGIIRWFLNQPQG